MIIKKFPKKIINSRMNNYGNYNNIFKSFQILYNIKKILENLKFYYLEKWEMEKVLLEIF